MSFKIKKINLWIVTILTILFIIATLLELFLVANISQTNIYNCSQKEKNGYIVGSILAAITAIFIIIDIVSLINFIFINRWIKKQMEILRISSTKEFCEKYPDINIEELFADLDNKQQETIISKDLEIIKANNEYYNLQKTIGSAPNVVYTNSTNDQIYYEPQQQEWTNSGVEQYSVVDQNYNDQQMY